MADFKLVVTQQFGDRAVGETITNAEEMAAVLETHPHAVVRAPVEDPNPDAEADAKAKADAKAARATTGGDTASATEAAKT